MRRSIMNTRIEIIIKNIKYKILSIVSKRMPIYKEKDSFFQSFLLLKNMNTMKAYHRNKGIAAADEIIEVELGLIILCLAK